jgi:hypothetical protein
VEFGHLVKAISTVVKVLSTVGRFDVLEAGQMLGELVVMPVLAVIEFATIVIWDNDRSPARAVAAAMPTTTIEPQKNPMYFMAGLFKKKGFPRFRSVRIPGLSRVEMFKSA